MIEKTYFFDSYAIFEILNGSVNYSDYQKAGVITAKNNLFEVYYNLLKEGKREIAKQILEKEYEHVVEIEKSDIIEAANLRFLLRKQKVSMVDCFGYVIAKRLNIKFLTGDKEFKGMDNVEFVK